MPIGDPRVKAAMTAAETRARTRPGSDIHEAATEAYDRIVSQLFDQRGDVEDTRPEPRTAVPELVRGGVFPIKARLVKLLAFENDPNVVDEQLLIFRDTLGDNTLTYSGALVNRVNPDTGALTAIGLAQQVNEWLLLAEEIDMLDWELSQDAITGYPRFLIIYTE